MVNEKNKFVRNPKKDFSRQRTFDFATMIKFILSAGCNTLATELMNFFDFQQFLSVSALVQQREKFCGKHFTISCLNSICCDANVYKYFAKGDRFDFIENLKSPDYEISIRFVWFKLDNGEYEVLSTSLSEEIFSAADLKEIFHMRWGIETSYRLSKWSPGMVSYHSKKPENVKQEVYAGLIMYNFAMYICADLNTEERGKKHPQQINFTQAIKICLHFFRTREAAQTFDVEATILKFLLPIKTGRSYQRKAVSKSVVGFNYRLS